jgi:hypothetical protein
MARLRSIVFDCRGPSELAPFWAEALGYRLRPYTDEDIAMLRAQGIEDIADDPNVVIDPPAPDGPTIWFNRVPETKTVKNRVHLDLDLEDQSELDHLIDAGATVVEEVNRNGHGWTVMADPEGNEFCAFIDRAKGAGP